MIRSMWFCQIRVNRDGVSESRSCQARRGQHRCWTLASARNRSATPRCPAPRSARVKPRPASRRARDRTALHSATSTFANASSAASIIPADPPAITTACSVIGTSGLIHRSQHAHSLLHLRGFLLAVAIMRHTGGLCQAPVCYILEWRGCVTRLFTLALYAGRPLGKVAARRVP